MKRILVTGSRFFTDKEKVRSALFDAWIKLGAPQGAILVHGGAPGADTLAHEIWRGPIERHPVTKEEWRTIGKPAGPLRNKKMVDLGADICVAFFDQHPNVGTNGCVKLARAAGIPVIEVHA